jgi:hypothetical protein
MRHVPKVNEVWCLGVVTRSACVLYCITKAERLVLDEKEYVVAEGVDLSTGVVKALSFQEGGTIWPSGWVGWSKVD